MSLHGVDVFIVDVVRLIALCLVLVGSSRDDEVSTMIVLAAAAVFHRKHTQVVEMGR